MMSEMTNEKILSIMKNTAHMIALEREKHVTLGKLVRAITMKGRRGTVAEIDYLVAAFEYAAGLTDRFAPKSASSSAFFSRGRWPTHLRDEDLAPVRISSAGIVYDWQLNKIATLLDKDHKVGYTSIKEMRGETDGE
jgi:hypothetical protein